MQVFKVALFWFLFQFLPDWNDSFSNIDISFFQFKSNMKFSFGQKFPEVHDGLLISKKK